MGIQRNRNCPKSRERDRHAITQALKTQNRHDQRKTPGHFTANTRQRNN